MADEGKLVKERNRGEQADRVLNNPLFRDAVQEITDGIYGEFANSTEGPVGDTRRQTAHMKLMVLNELLKDLRKIMATGKAAAIQLEQER